MLPISLCNIFDADDFNDLNNDQRIILASHRFAPEVITAALWLNDKAPGENLITCVSLTPFQDTDTGSLYIQANNIIPVPGIEKYVVGIGDNRQVSSVSGTSLGEKLQATFKLHSNDQITAFLRQVDDLAIFGLPDEIMPDRKSRWAGKYYEGRYYHFGIRVLLGAIGACPTGLTVATGRWKFIPR